MRTIEVDTRQQAGKHKRKHADIEAMGYNLLHTKLPFGDYRLVGGTVVVDTKRNIRELAQNLRQDHERFRAECEGARKCGYHLIILTEAPRGVRDLASFSKWYEPQHEFRRAKTAKVRLYGKPLAKTCETMYNKYDVTFDFCTPKEAGKRIVQLLEQGEEYYRKMRAR